MLIYTIMVVNCGSFGESVSCTFWPMPKCCVKNYVQSSYIRITSCQIIMLYDFLTVSDTFVSFWLPVAGSKVILYDIKRPNSVSGFSKCDSAMFI